MISAHNNSAQPASLDSISFMGANYVARCVGYHMTAGWNEGDSATNRYFQPLETFAARLEELLQGVQAMGFTRMDLWMAHLNYTWATQQYLEIATRLFAQYNLRITSLAGYFGSTLAEFEAVCRIATTVGTTMLGGSTSLLSSDRPSVVAILKEHGVRLGIENHPGEKNAQDMLRQVADGSDGTIGTTIDTGWYATNGYDAVRAIEELHPHIFHIHLKDILATGAHETCRYGRGVVDIPGCVAALRRLGYNGIYSIEHEPELFDPTEDCIAMFAMLRNWLA